MVKGEGGGRGGGAVLVNQHAVTCVNSIKHFHPLDPPSLTSWQCSDGKVREDVVVDLVVAVEKGKVGEEGHGGSVRGGLVGHFGGPLGHELCVGR